MKTDTTKVKEVWDRFAQKYGTDKRASTPDGYLVGLEIRVLLKHIDEGDFILDIGCGNGYTDIKLASKKEVSILGLDISTPLIKYASMNALANRSFIKGLVHFGVRNILKEGHVIDDNRCDKVITKRTLINILTWNEQQLVISKIWRALKPNGKYIMIEATSQGYENISRLRERFNIQRTPIRWHNNYLDEDLLLPFLKSIFKSVEYKDFSSTYYIGSRLIQPLLKKPFGIEPRYDYPLNWLFANLPSFGNYGIQKLIVCKK